MVNQSAVGAGAQTVAGFETGADGVRPESPLPDCAFCRIADGFESADMLLNDDEFSAFLDIAPVSPGHSLVITNKHYPSIVTLPDDLRGRMLAVATRLAVAVSKSVDADGFNLLISNGTCAGQVVRHAHIHIIPRGPLDGLPVPPVGGSLPSQATTNRLVTKIRRRLSRET